MIDRIIDLIRAKVNKMLGKSRIENILRDSVAISSAMGDAIALWSAMYRDDAPWLNASVRSLNLPALIASEIAMLTTIEAKSEVTGSLRADYINEQYARVMDSLRRACEFAAYGGALIFKPYVEGDKILCDYVRAENFFPLSEDLQSAVFVEQTKLNSATYTRFETHRLQGGVLTVTNTAFRGEGFAPVSLENVPKWAQLAPEVTIANVKRPLYAYFRVPSANSIEPSSPLGVSVYARAVDLIRAADEQYSRLLWEYEGGELAVDVDMTAFDSSDKLPRLNRRLFRRVPLAGGVDRGDFYSVFSPTLRDASLISGLNEILRKIEDACGLSHGTFSDARSEAKTATEVKVQKQRSYATIADMQKSLQTALREVVEIMDICATLYSLAPSGEYEQSFSWDDSLIVDIESEQAIWLSEVQAGIISKEKYLMMRYGLTEEQAKELLPSASASSGLFEGE